MTDINEQAFSSSPSQENGPQAARSFALRLTQPIFRFRPAIEQAGVVRALRTQIFPKIALALRNPHAKKTKDSELESSEQRDGVEHFAMLSLAAEEDAVFSYIEKLLGCGVTIDFIYMEVLAPAAGYLGRMWETDIANFAQVSIAMSRIQRVLRDLSSRQFPNSSQEGNGDSVLLTVIPGEQHSFGLSLATEYFRRAGWKIETGPFDNHRQLTSLVHDQWFDVVGFSVSSDRKLDELKKDVCEIRRGSRNRAVGIVLGGPMLVSHPELAESIGADLVSTDATTASQQARSLVNRMQGRA